MKKNFNRKYLIIIILLIIVAIPALIFIGNNLFEKKADPHAQQGHPALVVYEVNSTKKMLDTVSNRQPLSATDQNTRKALTEMANPISQTDTYYMEYLSSPDSFMVEIRSTDIDQAKLDAANWLKSQGLSDDAICHLPVVFYLSGDTAEQLQYQNIQFNPLPPGC